METTYTSYVTLNFHTPPHHTYLTWSLLEVPPSQNIFHAALTTSQVYFVSLSPGPAPSPGPLRVRQPSASCVS